MKYCYVEQSQYGHTNVVCINPLEYGLLVSPLVIVVIIVSTVYSARKQKLETVLRKCEEVLDNVD
jgi:hypothetical protein